MVFEIETGRMIHGDVHCITRVKYDSAEGARNAARAKSKLKQADKRRKEALDLMPEAEVVETYAPSQPVYEAHARKSGEVTGIVNQPVSNRPAAKAASEVEFTAEEIARYRANHDRHVNAASPRVKRFGVQGT